VTEKLVPSVESAESDLDYLREIIPEPSFLVPDPKQIEYYNHFKVGFVNWDSLRRDTVIFGHLNGIYKLLLLYHNPSLNEQTAKEMLNEISRLRQDIRAYAKQARPPIQWYARAVKHKAKTGQDSMDEMFPA